MADGLLKMREDPAEARTADLIDGFRRNGFSEVPSEKKSILSPVGSIEMQRDEVHVLISTPRFYNTTSIVLRTRRIDCTELNLLMQSLRLKIRPLMLDEQPGDVHWTVEADDMD